MVATACEAGTRMGTATGARLTQLDFSGARDKNVGRLDVAVDLPLRMQVIEALERLAEDRRDLALVVDVSGIHDVENRAAIDVLHNEPQLGAVDVRTIVLGDVRRVALRHHSNLLLDVLDLVLGLLEVHHLHGDRVIRLTVHAAEDGAERTATDLFDRFIPAALHRARWRQGANGWSV